MKSWKTSVAALGFLGLTIFGGDVELPSLEMSAQQPAAVAAVETPKAAPVGAPAPVPIGTIPVGQIVQLNFTDLTAAVARKSHLGYYPRPAGSIFFPAVGLNGEVAVFFSSPVAAKILVWIDSPTSGGKVAHAEMEIVVGKPGPIPDPIPDPDPTPDPTPTPQPVQIVVVEETSDSTAAMTRVRNSAQIRQWAEANGHAVFFVDKESATAKGGTWKTWADRAVRHSLPWIFVTPIDGGDTILNGKGEGELCPKTVAAFLALAKRYGGEGVGCKDGVCK